MTTQICINILYSGIKTPNHVYTEWNDGLQSDLSHFFYKINYLFDFLKGKIKTV